jgi:hypothetical protein
MQQLFIQFIYYVWQFVHVSALHCHPQGVFLVPSERGMIPEDGNVMPKHAHHITRHNTTMHNILSSALN